MSCRFALNFRPKCILFWHFRQEVRSGIDQSYLVPILGTRNSRWAFDVQATDISQVLNIGIVDSRTVNRFRLECLPALLCTISKLFWHFQKVLKTYVQTHILKPEQFRQASLPFEVSNTVNPQLYLFLKPELIVYSHRGPNLGTKLRRTEIHRGQKSRLMNSQTSNLFGVNLQVSF